MPNQTNHSVVITGASRGIGEATAYCFARHGYTLILTYNNSNKQAMVVSDNCARLGARHTLVLPLNIRDSASRKTFITQLAAHHARVDILINNAGVLVRKPLQLQTEEEIDWQIETNLSGPIKLTQALLPYGLTLVINVASDLSKYGLPDFSVYCASKFGLRGFTQALAQEQQALRVLCVNPDKTGTEMNAGQGRKAEVPAEIVFKAAQGLYPVATGGDVDVRELVERGTE
jgi:3-oxoacyl-[acyl-carrier protein] reductase